IDEAIGERGDVLDRATPALARLRRQLVRAHDDAREAALAIVRSATYANAVQDAIVTLRDGRFVVPIKAEAAGSIRGVVHDTSASGQTLFVEPLAVLDANNRVRRLRLDEEHEVARILAELSERIGACAGAIAAALDALVALDLIVARARLAQQHGAVEPEIVDEPRIVLYGGRHPLLGERAVPATLAIDDRTQILVISGPNMGGKTVALKLVAVTIAMAYCGLQIAATPGSVVGGFDFVGCEVGDEQSIAANASTFSAHLQRLREMVEVAGRRTLVLVDEIAGGTEPAAGAALAIAVLERLLAVGARAIVTTHAAQLKLFAHAIAGVENAGMRFDPATFAPTYELELGAPGQSLALSLARALGVDGAIVERAETLVSTGERDYDRALADLAQIRAEAAAQRDALVRERGHLATLEENARRRVEALDRERRAIAARANEQIAGALRSFNAELGRRHADTHRPARVTPGQSGLLARTLDQVHRELGLDPSPKRDADRSQVAVGDRVRVPALDSEGVASEDYGETMLVSIGALKTVVAKRELELVARGGARPQAAVRSANVLLETASNVRTELDVRGKRFVEAEPLVERWIEEARLVDVSPLRLIHGKGSGLLGRGLQEYLRALDGIRAIRYGQADEGGSGVTIIELA
ncbi:MAG: endonuclease MutS2, partial [Vulcanimicrobiaceae bacterium]